MKENKEAGISQNDSKKAERPERKKRTSVKENKKEKTSKLKIIPLGGLEQIGMNITAFEYEDSIIVVDCGLSFPEDDMYGIDLVIPDVTYLKDNIDKVKGFFITHGHEDHIGAIPYVLRDINVPIYATKLTIGIIEHKLKEHNMLTKVKRKVVKYGQHINLGCFRVEFIRTNHSIQDAAALAISIYFFLCLRLTPQTAPWGSPWGVWIWLVAAWSGFHCHARQCALADYYRNAHLYFQKGDAGSELDSYDQQRALMKSLPWNRREWFRKIYLYFYANYTRGQERQAPAFRRFYLLMQERHPEGVPQAWRDRFRMASRPLMKYANILTFDARVIVLFASLFAGLPWLFFVFEIAVLEPLRFYMRHVHESFCRRFANELEHD